MGVERKICGRFHIKLNIGARPIANKYREGKMKRTLERELKVPEIAERKALGPILHSKREGQVSSKPSGAVRVDAWYVFRWKSCCEFICISLR